MVDENTPPAPPLPGGKPSVRERLKRASQAAYERQQQRGALLQQQQAQRMCPHCQTRGQVKTAQVRVKKGISGGKATGAVLTAGLSLVATGLSRKATVTKATCGNCGMSWTIE